MLMASGLPLAYDVQGSLLRETIIHDTTGTPRILVPANTTLGILYDPAWTIACTSCRLRHARTTDMPASLCYNIDMLINVTAPVFYTGMSRSIGQYRQPWLPAMPVSIGMAGSNKDILAHTPVLGGATTPVTCNGTQFYVANATETTCMPTATVDQSPGFPFSMLRMWRNASYVLPPTIGTCGNLTVYLHTDGLIASHTDDPCFPVVPGHVITCHSSARCISIDPVPATQYMMAVNLVCG